MAQKPPQRVSAQVQSSNPATFIFLHGYGDDADGFTNIAHQFQSANKLPHLSWLFPNAPHNHEAMTTAWYPVTSFSLIPAGGSAGREENEDEGFDEEGEDGILDSVEYLCSLIDDEVANGVQPSRIIIGGFSQGCAVSLVTALASRWSGKIGGVVGLSGYLPRGKKIRAGREKFEKGDAMKVFLANGKKDTMIPKRVFKDTLTRVEGTIGKEALDIHEYDGLGHATSGQELRDVCVFLERVVPE